MYTTRNIPYRNLSTNDVYDTEYSYRSLSTNNVYDTEYFLSQSVH